MKDLIAKLSNYKFVLMITIVTLAAIILSGLSIYIYISTGAVNIDLSRPGYEKNREDTAYNEDEIPFSNSGPINNEVVDDFNQRIEKLQNELAGMNNFSAEAMSDEALGL